MSGKMLTGYLFTSQGRWHPRCHRFLPVPFGGVIVPDHGMNNNLSGSVGMRWKSCVVIVLNVTWNQSEVKEEGNKEVEG